MKSREEMLMARFVALGEGGLRARFWAGLSLPLQAVRMFLGRPKLLLWAIVPALINVALFVGAVVLLVKAGGWLLSLLWGQPDVVVWFDWIFLVLWWVLFGVMGLVGVVLSYFLVLMVGSLVASPFNDVLSERVEQALTGQVVGADGSSGMRDWLGSLVGTLRTFFSYLLIIVPLFGLNLIPGLGSVLYTVLAAVCSSFFLVLDFAGAPLDRRGMGFRKKAGLILGNKDFTGGFGAGASLLMFVPVLNLVAMPVLVVSGTIAGLSLHAWAPVAKQLEGEKEGKQALEQDLAEQDLVGQD